MFCRASLRGDERRVVTRPANARVGVSRRRNPPCRYERPSQLTASSAFIAAVIVCLHDQ